MVLNKSKLVKVCATTLLSVGLLGSTISAQAADYIFDKEGMHAFIQFRVKHAGFSWLYGRFNNFDGTFSYDKDDPKSAKVSVTIDTTSVDSNHAERDKHLRNEDFLNVEKFPEAKFESTSFDGKTLKGNLTLLGETKPVEIDVEKIGEGDDRWGGYRAGFEGTTNFTMGDFGMKKDFGTVEMILSVEGIKK